MLPFWIMALADSINVHAEHVVLVLPAKMDVLQTVLNVVALATPLGFCKQMENARELLEIRVLVMEAREVLALIAPLMESRIVQLVPKKKLTTVMEPRQWWMLT
jgi:hypothetical protein